MTQDDRGLVLEIVVEEYADGIVRISTSSEVINDQEQGSDIEIEVMDKILHFIKTLEREPKD